MYNNFVDNTENINEIDINKNKKLFEFIPVDYEYISPYDYNDYFMKNMSFNDFAKNISYLINYDVLIDEVEHLKKFYKKSSIKQLKLENIFNKKKYENLIEVLIKIKRLEYLDDFIEVNKFEIFYKVYLNNTLENIRKNKKNLIDTLFTSNKHINTYEN
tara:strand:- start:317 stop:793 length:477 start_codon:yes stop_codon:yes gene_type:complete